MIYDVSFTALIFFIIFVGLVLGLSFYFGSKTKSASSYYAAGGQIHWSVNGIAFAGDYLSAASFLGICGMIAVSGFDGFLYAIGFLAGWMVALFLVAEPFKKLGKYTFSDALNSTFQSRLVTLTASISTLIVSIFYLIPQMVGAGDLVTPLLGLPHWVGVVLVGIIVILIVATAGMTSTTYVQFLKGGLLIILSTVLTVYILQNGFTLSPDHKGKDYHKFMELSPVMSNGTVQGVEGWNVVSQKQVEGKEFVELEKGGVSRWFNLVPAGETFVLKEVLSITEDKSGVQLFNGEPKENGKFYQVGHLSKIIVNGKEVDHTGPVGPFEYLTIIKDSEVVRFSNVKFNDNNSSVSLYYPAEIAGKDFMLPGLKYKIGKGASLWSKMDFVSLMLALFLGTAALPHILIRYYTVKSPRDARKSTILAIAAIGAFYVLTLFMGLGSATNGVMDVESSNMAAPLLARAFGVVLFSIISAIAFATVLGTVAGLIVASSGAIAHDLLDGYFDRKLDDKAKVRAGKISAFAVGIFAIALGVAFKGMNVSFLVGWAFAIAASANLPAILFLLFWKKTTAKGISWSIIMGIVSSLAIILTSPTMWGRYGFNPTDAIHQLENPAIISFPLSALTLYLISSLAKSKPLQFRMKEKTVYTILILLVLFFTREQVFAQNSQAKYMSVGVAKVDITPEGPVRLAGFGARVKTESEGIAGRLYAKALAFGADKQEPSILITVDLIGVPSHITKALANSLSEKVGLNPNNLAISASHTHSGPEVGNLINILQYRGDHFADSLLSLEHLVNISKYIDGLLPQLESVALEALNNRKPSTVAWGQGEVGFAFNRRTAGGPVDHAMPLMSVTDADGRLSAVFVNYACHGVILGGQMNHFHGDWIGEAQRIIEENHPGTVAMVAIGCGADSNPSKTGIENLSNVEQATFRGKEIADEAKRLLNTKLKPINSIPKGYIKQIELPFSFIPTVPELIKQTEDKTVKGYYARLALDRIARGERIPENVSYPVQTWIFGKDLAMVFLPGEVVVDYSLRLKNELNSEKLWINAYSNDVPSYIPSKRILKEGGYEAESSMYYYDKPSPYSDKIEDLIINSVHELIPKSYKR